MCNCLHVDSVKIPKSGRGWKLFRVEGFKLKPMCWDSGNYFVEKSNAKEVVWKLFETPTCISQFDGGFCFFLLRKEAERCLRFWRERSWTSDVHTHKLFPILYSGGLGEHDEALLIRGHSFKVALCQNFEVVADDKYRLS